jgi:isoquinoline 1-oxidoreductase beta subunit
MVYAAMKQPPVFGGRLKSFNFDAIKNRIGIIGAYTVTATNITNLPDASGIAVVADSWWRAKTALEAMPIEWNAGPNRALGSADLFKQFAEWTKQAGLLADERGDVDSILNDASAHVIEAYYSAPYDPHATMEPMNCTAQVSGDRVDVWVPSSDADDAADLAARAAGVPRENVYVHLTFVGGSFGRRVVQDYVPQAVAIAKQLDGRPVKLLQTREEDIRHDNSFHPGGAAMLRAVLGADGMPRALLVRKAGDGYGRPTELGPNKTPMNRPNIEVLDWIPYAIPNLRVEAHDVKSPFPTSWLRGTGSLWNVFMLDSFIDELAVAAGKDPYQYRRALIANAPVEWFNGKSRELWIEVLDAVAKSSGWGTPLPRGQGRGITVDDRRSVRNRTNVPGAVVAKVTVTPKGVVTIDRVDLAIDTGHATINPQAVERQLRGQVAWAMGLTLKQEVTFDKGGVQQSNFHDFPIVKMDEFPKDIRINLIKSPRWAWGIGEEISSQIIPAICNAIFAATGKRVRSLPVKNHDLSWA